MTEVSSNTPMLGTIDPAALNDLEIEAENQVPEKPNAYREGVVAGIRMAIDICRIHLSKTPGDPR